MDDTVRPPEEIPLWYKNLIENLKTMSADMTQLKLENEMLRAKVADTEAKPIIEKLPSEIEQMKIELSDLKADNARLNHAVTQLSMFQPQSSIFAERSQSAYPRKEDKLPRYIEDETSVGEGTCQAIECQAAHSVSNGSDLGQRAFDGERELYIKVATALTSKGVGVARCKDVVRPPFTRLATSLSCNPLQVGARLISCVPAELRSLLPHQFEKKMKNMLIEAEMYSIKDFKNKSFD
ncbi:hypothetical protein GE061_001677 [Apolygus lucorum]|uniref:Uncharacterized protein n=1 Tax=Apolygus lucorum TaxID=248454 RepID=A0A8S9Y815_APOLU|nr:hypothetical protein GE061_001677 [Apolygus lucorum]